ncbi:hypothetical protein BDFB_003316, partial [Asbolus verrucosus]
MQNGNVITGQYCNQNPNIFVVFSLYTNTKSLLSIKCSQDSLTCLNGIKVLSIMWIIIGHIFVFKLVSPNISTIYIITETGTGLVCHCFISHWCYQISRRRSILALNSQKDYRNLLCHLCLDHCWYLSLDTQLYILAPIIVFNINKYPKKVLTGMVIAGMASVVYTFTVVVIKKIGYLFLFDSDESFFHYIYNSPLSRMPAWLIGVFFGYLIYEHHTKKIRISNSLNFILWTFSLTFILGNILYHNVLVRNQYSIMRSAINNAFGRPLWSFAVSSIIYNCCLGHAKFINAFLSHPIFIVLGKLTYSMFLVHLGVIAALMGGQKHAGQFSSFE